MTALFPTYKRFNLAVERAEGTTVEDTDGKTYLDFGAGIGVCNLGHRHPAVQEALESQLNRYWHVSNLYHNPIQEKVAELLTTNTSGDQVFFCNSGTEANEAAIKLARKATGKHKIITFEQSFHGRTFGAMAATGQEKIHSGFGPMLEGFSYVPFNDIDAVKQAVDGETAAVMLEVIQGEGGLHMADAEFVQELEKICAEHHLLLIVDEVQTGIGRTGKPFAYQHYGISPDIITSAKGLANGVPVGAMIAKESLREAFGPGAHAATFGGNPLAMAAGEAVLTHVFQDDFLQDVTKKGQYLKKRLKEAISDVPIVSSIRGKGLMVGIECSEDVSHVVPQLIEQGLLVLVAGSTIIRLLPPLTVNEQEIDQAVDLLRDVLTEKKISSH
ncbi:acetylornithine transaminase [Lentibacillus amyloliquefaciens]|uniref:Acetylornithine aminotransferase n=1 Tax=Lentibacillus amyloliquefaciens TaxID=1472767 RepID=A0A0U4E6E6_9BACI|nr:acetylornithine transaminase [Lentibacillus amyloliquefaciens]ALX48449.1 acetylornithine aminotransferase [Lentibacillus amyloliquefaciens]